MNIRFGDTGLIVDYIQAFLQNYYSNSTRISGIYDSETHKTLLKYLNINNVREVNYVYNRISREIENFDRNFIPYKNADDITLYTKSDSQEMLDYVTSIRSRITKISEECGWRVTEYRLYSEDNRYKILIGKRMFENILPNKEMLPFINLFYDEYKYGYDIVNNSIVNNYDTDYKLAVLECKPNTLYKISHAYGYVVNMEIACSSYDMKKLSNAFCSKVDSFYLGEGVYHEFMTDEDSKTMIIKVPYNKTGASSYSIEIPIVMGDVNLDGVVDLSDSRMISSYLMGDVELSDAQLFAANVLNHSSYSEINQEDADLIEQYALTNTNGGIKNYTQVINAGQTNDANMILVTVDPGDINMPVYKFSEDRWAIHSKFLDYLLGMAITEYSTEEDIRYLQRLLRELYNTNEIPVNGIFDKTTMDYLYNYQIYLYSEFALGYLDSDTEAQLVKDVDAGKTIGYISGRQ